MYTRQSPSSNLPDIKSIKEFLQPYISAYDILTGSFMRYKFVTNL